MRATQVTQATATVFAAIPPYPNWVARPPAGHDIVDYALCSFPPVMGCATPVVVGSDSGNPLTERTAR
jgi:hypothetical protein